jgi:hypothetical protein
METLRQKKANLKAFEINIPEKVLDDLQDRLKNTRWIQSINGEGWTAE